MRWVAASGLAQADFSAGLSLLLSDVLDAPSEDPLSEPALSEPALSEPPSEVPAPLDEDVLPAPLVDAAARVSVT